ncbi:MAG: hypothetical protein WCF17_00755 [Terracidiphilus sp.]
MRHPIQNAHASLKANIWLLDEAACNERSGRQEPPDKEKNKSKSKNKSKNAAKEKTSSARGQHCLRERDFSAQERPKNPKSKNKSALDKRRFHT